MNTIRCPKCEGWGVSAYSDDGSGIPCDRCGATGKVEEPPEPEVPLYGRYENLCRRAETGIGCSVAHPFTSWRCGEQGKGGWHCDKCKTIRALCNAVATLENEEY